MSSSFPGAFRSTVAKKAVMAATGLVLVGYVLVHMAANLQIFAGAAAIDGYARGLRERPVLLWSVRALLAAAFAAHVVVAVQLARRKQAARPVRYRVGPGIGAHPAARSMIWTGALLAVFLVVHLANLTWGTLHPRFVPLAVYHNVVALFRVRPVAVFYGVAVLALGLHVAHGAWSLFQSLGVTARGGSAALRIGARVAAAALVAGLLAVVLAAATGALPAGGAP
jgi:succinate dehydrogenase / fumarate reductase cytochrome b subunit